LKSSRHQNYFSGLLFFFNRLIEFRINNKIIKNVIKYAENTYQKYGIAKLKFIINKYHIYIFEYNKEFHSFNSNFLIFISALILIEDINKKRNVKAKVIKISGTNNVISIDGADNLLTLAG